MGRSCETYNLSGRLIFVRGIMWSFSMISDYFKTDIKCFCHRGGGCNAALLILKIGDVGLLIFGISIALFFGTLAPLIRAS